MRDAPSASSQQAHPFEAVIHPYRSLSADGFRVVMGIVLCANFLFAIVALSLGGWPVIPFLGLDVLALYLAFQMSYRQARAFERVQIDVSQTVVERVDANGKSQCTWCVPSYWTFVSLEGDAAACTITLRHRGQSLTVGDHLAPAEREDFAVVIARELRTARASWGAA